MTINTKVWAPVGTFVAVLAVGGAAALLTGGGGTSAAPRHLPLSLAAERDAAALTSASGGGAYTLTGTLPAGTPDDAPAWMLAGGSADAALVNRLAKALGAGAAVREGEGWRAGGLRVSGERGQSWYFSPCGPDTAVSSDGSTAGISYACADDVRGGSSGSGSSSTSSGTVTAEPAPPPVPADGTKGTPPSPGPEPAPVPEPSAIPEPSPIAKSVVVEGARDVFTALGLDIADAQITTSGYGGAAALHRQVGGLDTLGLTTRVDVNRAGTVVSANGWLGGASKGDTYPLISAKAAFDALPGPVRMLACPVGPDGQGCVEPEPAQVTGAHLGLSLQALMTGEQVLIPSWLFDVKGWEEPVAGVAVEPSYLTPEQPTPDPAGTKPGTEPGTGTDPVPPTQVDPATGAPEPGTDPGTIEPAPAQEPVALMGAQRSKATNAVTVLYEGGGCGRTGLAADVKESADSVVVFLRADVPPADQMCTTDSRQAPFEVALQGPLGNRQVIDGSTGKPVPLT